MADLYEQLKKAPIDSEGEWIPVRFSRAQWDRLKGYALPEMGIARFRDADAIGLTMDWGDRLLFELEEAQANG